MSKCELCKSTARVYCESDEARLCWSCDAKVHSANFLVARHVRNLLCHSCQSPTAWSGSGEKLGRTISLCEPCVVTNCVKHAAAKVESEGEREGSSSGSGTDFDSDEEEEEEDDENIVEDSYNQVVPLASSTCQLPPVVSSSSSEDRSRIDTNVSLKRSRDYVLDLNSKDDGDSSCIAGEENSSYVEHPSSLRPFKFRKLQVNETGGPKEGTSTGLRRVRHLGDMNGPISGVEAYECVDFDLNECPFDQQQK